MKHLRVLFLGYLLFLNSFISFSQSLPNKVDNFLVNPSTNRANYSQQDLVDLYTGKINLNVPLYTIEQGDLSVSFQLNYNNDGIKVDDISSWVGLGWQLQGGGSIIREMRGNPDEHNTCGRFVNLVRPHLSSCNNYTIDNYVDQIRNGTYQRPCYLVSGQCAGFYEFDLGDNLMNDAYDNTVCIWGGADTEPDIFHYTLPNSFGSFILDQSGNAKVIAGPRDITIIPAIGPMASTQNKWTIISADGTIHDFPTSSNYTETTRLKVPGSMSVGRLSPITKEAFAAIPVDYYSMMELDYISIWNLSSMTSGKNSTNSISFTYQVFGNIEDYTCTEQKIEFINSWKFHYYNNIDCPDTDHQYKEYWGSAGYPNSNTLNIFMQASNHYWLSRLRTILNAKYLSEITFTLGKMKFVASSTNRVDLANNKSLSNIQVYDYNNTLIKNFALNQDYFSSTPGCSSESCKRLKLNSVSELIAGSSYNKYSFNYNETENLPTRGSMLQDYWGFYNNNTENTLLAQSSRGSLDFAGAVRSAYFPRTQANMLTKVTYPTNGYSIFEYEPNDFVRTPTLRTWGGIRVKSISTNDGTNTSITNYSYVDEFDILPSGRIPGTTVDIEAYFHKDIYFFDNNHEGNDDIVRRYEYDKRSATPLFPILKTRGGYVGYSCVWVSQPGIGKTMYFFTSADINSKPDDIGIKKLMPYHDVFTNAYPPENTHSSKDELRGLLTKIQYMDESNTLLKEVKLDYLDNPIQTQTTKSAMKIEKKANIISPYYPYIPEEGAYVVEFYDIKSYFPQVSKRTETSYLSGTPVSTETVYERSSISHLQVTKEILTESNTNKLIRVTTYPLDYSFSGGFSQAFQTACIVNAPVEQYVYRTNANDSNPVIIDGSLTTYKYGTNNQPEGKWDLETTKPINLVDFKISNKPIGFLKDSRYRQTTTFLNYDDYGNLLEQLTDDGLSTSYLYGYNHSYPIAKIKNAGTGQVFYQSFEESGGSTLLDGNNRNIAKTGRYVGTNGYSFTFNPPTTKSYILSYWYYDGTKWNFNSLTYHPSPSAYTLIIPTHYKLDEIRVCPKDAMMNTYSYDPLIGITSQTDPAGISTYYEYDVVGRLKLERDNDGNIVKRYSYHTKE